MPGDEERPESLRSELERLVGAHEVFGWLDIRLVTAEPGRVVFDVPAQAPFGTDGTMHGGIVATAVDTAAGFALRTTFEDPFAANLATTDLDVHYIRPARGELRIEGEVVRAGERMGFADAEDRKSVA